MVFQIPKLPIFGRSAVVRPSEAESSAPLTSAFGFSTSGTAKKPGFTTAPMAVSGPNPWVLPPALSPTLGGMLAHEAFFSDRSLKAQLNRYLKQSAPKEPLTLTLGYREGKRDGWTSALWQRFLPDMKHMIIVTPQSRRTLRATEPAADVSDMAVNAKPKFKKTRGLQLTQYTVLTMPKSQFGPLNSLLATTAVGEPQWIIKRPGQSWDRLDTPRSPEKLGYRPSTPPLKQWFHEMLSGWLNTLLGWPMEQGRLYLPNGRVWPSPANQWQTAQGESVDIKQVLKTPKGHWVEVVHSETQPWLPLHQRHSLRPIIDTIVRPWERSGAQLEQAPMPAAVPGEAALPANTIPLGIQRPALGMNTPSKLYGSGPDGRPNPFLRATLEARHKHNPLMSGKGKSEPNPPLPVVAQPPSVSPVEPKSTDPEASA